jgi:hypothetical protein
MATGGLASGFDRSLAVPANSEITFAPNQCIFPLGTAGRRALEHSTLRLGTNIAIIPYARSWHHLAEVN